MICFYDQNIWNAAPTEYRNGLVRLLVDDFDADVCAFQECSPKTNRAGENPIDKLMSDKYTEVCPDKADKNFTPIFYKTEKFNLIDSGYILYDGLNDMNSKSVTWAVFEQKDSKDKFAAISTHFWWKCDSEADNEQRLNNVLQLKKICDSIVCQYDVPVIIGGDFNNGKKAEQGDMPYKSMLKNGFCDIRLCAKESTDEFTHHEYPILTDEGTYVDGAMPIRNLDNIFTYGTKAISVKKFDVITSQKALNSSDHCPLIGYFEF